MRISNIRVEESDEWAWLVADIDSESKRFDKEKTIWISGEKNNKWMLSVETYNCFLILPLYMVTYYHENLRINGKVSKQLFRNVNSYLEPIMMSFSKKLSGQKLKLIVLQKLNLQNKSHWHRIVLGVDYLQTVY